MPLDDERRRVIFTGRVQGVGFRVTCAQIAQKFDVSGWVRNLPDGSVELQTQGPAGELDQFCAEIAARFSKNIIAAHRENLACEQKESGFRIEK